MVILTFLDKGVKVVKPAVFAVIALALAYG
jgi:hypothetical protein